MRIYKYNILKTPDAVRFARGLFQVEDYAIGFGEDTTSPDADKECEELTFGQYLDYAQSINIDINIATDVYNKHLKLSTSNLSGEVVTDKRQVSDLLRKNVQALFVDPNGLLTPVEYQILTISQVSVIILANAGIIKYEETGIPSVIDQASAGEYIKALLPVWAQVNALNQEAIQYVIDNNL